MSDNSLSKTTSCRSVRRLDEAAAAAPAVGCCGRVSSTQAVAPDDFLDVLTHDGVIVVLLADSKYSSSSVLTATKESKTKHFFF